MPLTNHEELSSRSSRSAREIINNMPHIKRRELKKTKIEIIPMIDTMFFLPSIVSGAVMFPILAKMSSGVRQPVRMAIGKGLHSAGG